MGLVAGLIVQFLFPLKPFVLGGTLQISSCVEPQKVASAPLPWHSLQVTIKTNLLAELKHQAPN